MNHELCLVPHKVRLIQKLMLLPLALHTASPPAARLTTIKRSGGRVGEKE
jgi:hypothetical protein